MQNDNHDSFIFVGNFKENMAENTRVGVGVLIFNPKGEILLGKRMNSHGKASFGPPGGHLEFGESFENCAIREVAEETGIEIQNPEFLAITNDIFQLEQKHYISIFMKVNYTANQEVRNREPHKTIEWKWFSMDELPEPLFLPLDELVAGNAYGGCIDNSLQYT